VTNGEREAPRPKSDQRRAPAGFAIVILIASVLPIPSGVFGDGAGGVGGSATVPIAVGLTAPFHFVGYAILAALATRVTGRTPCGLLLAVVAAVAFGFGIEVVQAPIPWRTFAWQDVGINAAGAVVGAAIVAISERRRARRLR